MAGKSSTHTATCGTRPNGPQRSPAVMAGKSSLRLVDRMVAGLPQRSPAVMAGKSRQGTPSSWTQ